ncbi:tetraspanin-33 isoform X2 [Chamaea fasciata]|uniref:tetraspanin-33 isoform X2 n=1 Tax=Chamaea fasciata TaxID=190680 RepID=UPI00336AA873
MARRAGVPAGPLGDDFSFVSPVVKYVLFFFNLLFWVISMVMVAVGVYARLLKHAEAAVACLAVDPAILLVMVGVLTFLITFCGCVGSLRENICLLQLFSVCLTIIFLLQLAAGVLGFVFSDKARGKVSEIINGAIVHYRDDLDLQNLIDFGQKELLRGCLLQGLVPEHVLQLHGLQPQPGALLRALLLLPARQQPGRHQHHVWPRDAGQGLPGGQCLHPHQRLHRQAGQLDPQQPLPAGGHRPGAGPAPAGGHRPGAAPHQPDPRPDQAAALQPAAPGGPLVLSCSPGAIPKPRIPEGFFFPGVEGTRRGRGELRAFGAGLGLEQESLSVCLSVRPCCWCTRGMCFPLSRVCWRRMSVRPSVRPCVRAPSCLLPGRAAGLGPFPLTARGSLCAGTARGTGGAASSAFFMDNKDTRPEGPSSAGPRRAHRGASADGPRPPAPCDTPKFGGEKRPRGLGSPARPLGAVANPWVEFFFGGRLGLRFVFFFF